MCFALPIDSDGSPDKLVVVFRAVCGKRFSVCFFVWIIDDHRSAGAFFRTWICTGLPKRDQWFEPPKKNLMLKTNDRTSQDTPALVSCSFPGINNFYLMKRYLPLERPSKSPFSEDRTRCLRVFTLISYFGMKTLST